MKKEIVICIIVIIAVIIGNILTQNYTKQCVSTMNSKLDELKGIISQENKNEGKIENQTEEVKQIWDNMQETLAFYIEHDELEKVETQLFLLSGEATAKLYDDAIPEIEKCMFILEHISDKTTLNIKNIF